jgi:hypothetical protein
MVNMGEGETDREREKETKEQPWLTWGRQRHRGEADQEGGGTGQSGDTLCSL